MKIALITTPRTGSTWLYQILFENLLRRNPEAVGFNEYFNVGYLLTAVTPTGDKRGSFRQIKLDEFERHPERWARDFIWNDGRIEQVLRPFTPERVMHLENLFRFGFIDDYLKSMSKERLSWLKKESRQDLILKIHAEDLVYNPNLIDYLARNFKVVLLRREDKPAQFLSWCKAQGTGIFDRPEKAQVEKPLEYKCEPGWFDFLMHSLRLFDEARERLKKHESVADVSYEELIALKHPNAILKRLGIAPEKVAWSGKLLELTKSRRRVKYRVTNPKQMARWLRQAENAGFTSSFRPPLMLRVPNRTQRRGRTMILAFDPNNDETRAWYY